MPLFPLPLSLFESYMFMDDCAGNTMTFPLTVRFQGNFERQALEEAYREAQQQHPLFRCIISAQQRAWFPADRVDGICWLQTKPEVFAWAEQRIEITKTSGLRFAVFQDEHSAEFYFLFHHTIADGTGFFQFINSLFEFYLQRMGQKIVPKSYDSTKLRNREIYDLPPIPHKVSWYQSFRFSFVEIIRWIQRRPLEPVTPKAIAAPPLGQFAEIHSRNIAGETVNIESKCWNRSGFLFARLSRERTSQILAGIKKRKQTVAAFLLARFFISLAETKTFLYTLQNGRTHSLRAKDILRIGLVCNMRGRGAAEIPACNIISYTFPTRQVTECQDIPEFYERISEEIHFVRDWHIGMIFLNGLAIFRRIPFLLRSLIRSQRCLATAILSSMNRIEKFFSPELPRDADGRIVIHRATLIEFQASVPCRRGTNLSITTNTYAGSLGFFVQYDAEKIDSNAAVDWLAEWLNSLQR
jgi:hypothetical protein